MEYFHAIFWNKYAVKKFFFVIHEMTETANQLHSSAFQTINLLFMYCILIFLMNTP